ncbi:TPA: protein-ADP-ribose hydrolase [Listeria monocytogenes]
MKIEEQLLWLLDYLIKENNNFNQLEIPPTIEDKKLLFRALLNIREPDIVSKEFIAIQNSYLNSENRKQIVNINDAIKYHDRVYLWQGDITTLSVDAIVNAANSQLLGCFIPLHQCIDNAIHSAAGVQLRLACSDLMEKQNTLEEIGKAKITEGYNLPAKYVIHTVGPNIKTTVSHDDEKLLENCYKNVLKLAVEKGIKTLAFCCISTGEFRFPNELATTIAVDTAINFLNEDNSDLQVIFNVFKEEDRILYDKELRKLQTNF